MKSQGSTCSEICSLNTERSPLWAGDSGLWVGVGFGLKIFGDVVRAGLGRRQKITDVVRAGLCTHQNPVTSLSPQNFNKKKITHRHL